MDTGPDAAIQKGGGIRTSTIYQPGTITDFPIRRILPFGNVTVGLEVSGRTIHDALENGVSEFESLEGRFPQVGGIEFVRGPDAPSGDRIDPADTTVAGQPLDTSDTYTLGTNGFVAGGGDGYDVLTAASETGDGGTNRAELVKDRIRVESPVAPEVEGRITRLSDGTTASLSGIRGR